MTQSWQFWALVSAAFAALTAIFGKVGVAGVNSDLATLIRTVVIFCVLVGIVTMSGEWQAPSTIGARTWVFLALSGLATGGSWIAYYRALKIGNASQVAPIDKLSIVFVAIFATLFLGEDLSPVAWGGIAMIAAGTVLVALF
ncbi:EamA family transporter [Rhizobium halophytocola]|uniref:Transporter family protein n=1 Tax=Rhizobium halophytocola TaxID=735519 RepID=A0ABS4DZM8_9HYPH|nr:EamA family transporter [Rhizobium halophytocola]MBP1851104.1 transporter family protein [Rhizobium halophytocola]